jgi:hypothetical protein
MLKKFIFVLPVLVAACSSNYHSTGASRTSTGSMGGTGSSSRGSTTSGSYNTPPPATSGSLGAETSQGDGGSAIRGSISKPSSQDINNPRSNNP